MCTQSKPLAFFKIHSQYIKTTLKMGDSFDTICIQLLGSTHIFDLLYTYMYSGTTPCPLFQNEKIVQQPADLIEITGTLMKGAESFINSAVGKLSLQVIVETTITF